MKHTLTLHHFTPHDMWYRETLNGAPVLCAGFARFYIPDVDDEHPIALTITDEDPNDPRWLRAVVETSLLDDPHPEHVIINGATHYVSDTLRTMVGHPPIGSTFYVLLEQPE